MSLCADSASSSSLGQRLTSGPPGVGSRENQHMAEVKFPPQETYLISLCLRILSCKNVDFYSYLKGDGDNSMRYSEFSI